MTYHTSSLRGRWKGGNSNHNSDGTVFGGHRKDPCEILLTRLTIPTNGHEASLESSTSPTGREAPLKNIPHQRRKASI